MTNKQFINNSLNSTYTAIKILQEIDTDRIAELLKFDIQSTIEAVKLFDAIMCDYSNGRKAAAYDI